MHNTDSAITQLQAAHSEALLEAITTNTTQPVLIDLTTAEQLMRHIESLRMRNAHLGALHAAASDANERVLAHAVYLRLAGQPELADKLTRLITENPQVGA